LSAFYAKLDDGSWGIRRAGFDLVGGGSVTVRKKDGTTKEETIQAIVKTLTDPDGNVVEQVCSIVPTKAPQGVQRASGGGYRSGRRTGCSCGSREDSAGDLIPSQYNCRSCRFDGED
jgi:hypothetical protein